MSKTEGKILIIDDNEELLVAFRLTLGPYFNEIRTASSPSLIPSILEGETFDVILLDMNFTAGLNTGNEGFYWMKRILEADSEAAIVLITAYGNVEVAVKAIKEGATDFIQKSWDKDKILSTILSAYQIRKSKLQIRTLKSKQKHMVEKDDQEYNYCPSQSGTMQEIMRIVDKVAPTEANILLLGENGTGKEVIAREIHRKSTRNNEMFVSVDLGSISENLFESELFGHVKGSFTDARSDRTGRIEIASGGTLFLDEIGNLPLSLQTKLLTAIQRKEIVRVGSNKAIPVDIRIICATNSPIYNLADEGRFREDLLYRINTIQIELPPLRERQEDIPLLANFFLEKYSRKYKKSNMEISQLALNKLQKHFWKGNIREFMNTIEKTVILSEVQLIRPGDFILSGISSTKTEDIQEFDLMKNEKQVIERALQKFGDNLSLTAQKLGINRTTLYNKIRKYGL
jgi:DNA-binding NtrC family response regulator